ncbi:MAG: sensor histidine kinase [Candidatus Zixiibacteriota bacterium]|nr:MAG: sensor histidine kinase [candidate division Zixibacteria bacterium]
MQDTVEYYRRRLPFEGEGIRIEFHPGNLPKTRINNELFAWAVENLVKNSLQAVDSRNGLVTVSTRVHETPRRIVIRVEDNGRGIPPGAARKIFRPGFTTKKRGWGMGLTLVKRIVEDYHGGRVLLAQTGPGKTVFEIFLPLVEETENQQ